MGGWIVNHLLARGEDPKNIRILDIRAPTRSDLTQGPAKLVEFIRTDITDEKSVIAGFTKPWPSAASRDSDITVFSTAASIRYYEQHPALVPLSTKVNVTGTENIIKGSLACGATILIYTSTASITVWSTRFLLAPWESEPKSFTQVLRDNIPEPTRPHNTFFSNYAYTKTIGEARVLAADKSSGAGKKSLRTGAIRPGNGIYGVGGDQHVEKHLKEPGSHPTWESTTIQPYIAVENCSLAHLCYEQRLVELERGGRNPDIGGRPFIVTDGGPPITSGDYIRTVEILAGGGVKFQILSASSMLLLAHVIQAYYLTTYFLSQSPNTILRAVGALLPKVSPLLTLLQPSIWSMTNIHLTVDDSNARARPEAGGLGYEPIWTTLEGICQVVLDFRSKRVVEEGPLSGKKDSHATSGAPRAKSGVKRGLDKAESTATRSNRLVK